MRDRGSIFGGRLICFFFLFSLFPFSLHYATEDRAPCVCSELALYCRLPEPLFPLLGVAVYRASVLLWLLSPGIFFSRQALVLRIIVSRGSSPSSFFFFVFPADMMKLAQF